MANIKITTKDAGLKKALKAMGIALKSSTEDVIDDLAQTSSGAAPKDRGILEGAFEKGVTVKGDTAEGYVEYAIKEGGYNYAIRMHEGVPPYKLGPKSVAKPGSSARIGGKTYTVGKKFLERPLQGSKEDFRDFIAAKLQDKFRT